MIFTDHCQAIYYISSQSSMRQDEVLPFQRVDEVAELAHQCLSLRDRHGKHHIALKQFHIFYLWNDNANHIVNDEVVALFNRMAVAP